MPPDNTILVMITRILTILPKISQIKSQITFHNDLQLWQKNRNRIKYKKETEQTFLYTNMIFLSFIPFLSGTTSVDARRNGKGGMGEGKEEGDGSPPPLLTPLL